MKRIDVRELGTEPVVLRWTGPADSLGLGTEPEFRAPVTVEVSARRLGTRVLLKGRAATTARLECSRCLEPFEQLTEAEVAVEFREGPPPTDADDAEGEDEADVTWFEPPYLNLGEEVRQSLLVAVPGYPVCRESCRGLCPVCGANRNEAACGHPVAPEAPRESLGALVDKEHGTHG